MILTKLENAFRANKKKYTCHQLDFLIKLTMLKYTFLLFNEKTGIGNQEYKGYGVCFETTCKL